MAADVRGLKVFVLGHRGMLGHVVARWLAERGAQVLTSDARYAGEAGGLVAEVAAAGCAGVVNCAATTGPGRMMLVNGLLPQHLAAALQGKALLVHASSDGVFQGTAGPYAVTAAPDALDEYGLSKRLGELAGLAPGTVVLRCSLVGPDPAGRPPRGLYGWLQAQRGEVTGYTDRLWNGVTTLEWAKLCERALLGELVTGLHQPACAEPLSKAELLEVMASVGGWPVQVRRAASGSPADRRLAPTLPLAPIREQLAALAAWYR
jgi:dTDP-4-dehydrorhamnose reductase